MDLTNFYAEIMGVVAPVLALSGIIALTISLICMLIEIIINACTGKGMKL